MTARVNRHTRRTKGGGRTTVHTHTRATRGRQRPARRPSSPFTPRAAFRNFGRAWRAARRSRRGRAAAFATLGAVELGGWLTLRGVALTATTVAVVALGIAFVATKSTGGDPR